MSRTTSADTETDVTYGQVARAILPTGQATDRVDPTRLAGVY